MQLINKMRQMVWSSYAVAVAATILTLFVHRALGLQADPSPTMLTLFILPILLSAFLGGFGPGLAATVLATLLAVYFLLHPITALDHLRWIVLASEGLLISLGSEVLHRQAGKVREQAALLDEAHVMVRDADDRIVFWNKGAEALYGWTKEEAVGQVAHDLLQTQIPNSITAYQAQLFAQGHWEGELTHTRKDGTPIVVVSHQVVRHNGRSVQILEVNNDITERKRAEAAVEASEARHRNLVENLPTITYIIDLDPPKRTTYISPQLKTILGFTPEEWLADPDMWWRQMHPKDRDRVFAEYERADSTGTATNQEYRLIARDGHEVWLKDRSVAIPDKTGATRYAHGILEDITERKQAEEKSQRGEQILRLFVEHSPADIAMFDRDMRYIVYSRRYLADYDLGSQDLTGRSHYEVFPEIPERWKEIHRQCLAGATAHSDEDPFPRASGYLDWIRWEIHPWYEHTGEIGGIILFSEIITERKLLLEKIQQHTLRLQFLTDISRAFAEAQPNYQALLDLIVREIAQALGDSCTIRLLSEDGALLELAAVYDVDPQVLEYTRAHLLGISLRADEPTLIQPVLANPEPVLAQSFDPQQTAAFSQPVSWPIPNSTAEHSRILVRMSVGGQPIGLLSIARRNPAWPAFNEENFSVVRDLADRAALAISSAQLLHKIQILNAGLEERIAQRTAQLAGANQDLRVAKDEADRANQAKSEFLSRMSHELRTPLNAILGFAQIMEMEVPSPHQQASLRHILNAGRHLLDLINEVLDISRIETDRLSLSLEPVSLGEVLQEAVDLIQPTAAQRKVRLILQGVFQQYVLVDRQRYKQILLNLLSNAVKYNREGGQVTVSYSLEPGPAAEKLVRLAMSDTGFGIPPEKLGRLFQPFDRLDAEATGVPGTGLGLALSKRLAEAMGGTLKAESNVGQGSTFFLETPAAQAPLEKIKTMAAATLPSNSANIQARTILCIEDNLSNLNLIEHIVARRSAIHLLSALQGGLGLELARQHRPDLILLDLNLPDLHGSQVLETLKADPVTQAIPVVVISADATHNQTTRLLEAGARTYLTKPLDVRRFLEILDELLPPDL